MSIRNLFDGETPYSIFSQEPEDIRNDGESLGNISETWKNKNRFIPQIDFSNPENFARYGSAKQYYEDSITRIYENYPYDGASKEKQEFLNQSTYIDLWLLENKYPRTNGYIDISAEGWGGVEPGGFPNVGNYYYGHPTVDEYIYFQGGPHTASGGMVGKTLNSTFDDSNVYDENIYDDQGFTNKGSRESNLKTDFDNGITVEFWLKKEAVDINRTQKEVIFDLWNNTTSSAGSYGRVTLELNTFDLFVGSPSPFRLTVRSGSDGFISQPFGENITLSTLQTFGHYSFRVYNSGSALNTDFYINGDLIESTSSGSNLNEVTGALNAQIGALITSASNGTSDFAGRGWGKFSGSLDEFRFWKESRTSEDIGRYWFTQVYGGTNSDISNASLGVYYKFNEGIVGDSSIDSSVLDYSGRITNGNWTGYTSNSRKTSSAMVLAGAAQAEFRDPIIYPEHPLVISLSNEMELSGTYYDYNNSTSLYNNFPNWIIDEDTAGDESGNLKKLTQIMSSYLDTLQLQIQEINKIKNISYVSGSNKEIPFSDELLGHIGLISPEIFTDSSVLNQIFNRDEEKDFSDELFNIKNIIYKNIYNNIVSIYKSKGTTNSFRNLIRCYGVDENLIKINAYANNLVYNLNENYDFSYTKKNFVDFYRPDTFNSTIYQQTSSGNPNSVSFISASAASLEKYTSFTYEVEAIFPKKKEIDNNVYYVTPFQTSSIFGFHTADATTPTDFSWPSTDYDLQVYSVRPNTNRNQKDGYLVVTSSFFGIDVQSDIIEDLYTNKKWNIALRFGPTRKHADLVDGTDVSEYDLELYAVNTDADIINQEILLTSSVTTDGDKYLTEPKRIYVGAHRQDFTGSTIHRSDLKISSVKYWMKHLNDSEIITHAKNSDNFGSYSPYKNSYNFVTSLTGTEIPEMETLALQWRFDQITGSDSGGGVPTVPDAGFTVLDYSSGSSEISQRYSWMGNVVGKQHTGRADFFYPEDIKAINVEFLPVAKQTTPEIVNSYDMVKVFNIEDEQLFTKQTRPVNFYYMIEKSMYRAITDEIVNFFSTILDFNNLIGDPVNRYRQEYKALGKLRSLFFEKVDDTPDVERYIEYYKWIDSSLSEMLMNLFPASAIKQDGLRTVIESHILERNKYWNKYPTVDMKQSDPESGIRGINELLYNWKSGHRPVSGEERESCFWWKERAERGEPPLATGDAGVDSDKEQILSTTISALNRKFSTPLRLKVDESKIISTGLNIKNNIRENIKKSVKFGVSEGIEVPADKLDSTVNCVDDLTPVSKIKIPYEIQNKISADPYMTAAGDLLAPFVSIATENFLKNGITINSGYNKKINDEFQPGFSIENMHIDSYINSEVPLQGPFTEKWVGGNQHRHIPLNRGTDNSSNRPEAWNMEFQSVPTALKFIHQPVNSPRAMLYRDMVAKRILNIKNIKDNAATGELGNYRKDYEIVQTCGRTENNSAFVKAGGFSVTESPSPYVAGLSDYTKPQRGRTEHVFVNRFSSPGDPSTAGDSDGGPQLDPEAAEFSVYNAINYRNTEVREIQRLLLASHVNQFGFYSDSFGIGNGPSFVNSLNYNGTGSVYQVNRNTIRQMKDSGSTTVTASVYNNFYVQHPIPRTDLQYAWITASAISYNTFGYLPYDGEGDLVTFSSASDFVSYTRTGFLPSPSSFGSDKKELGSFGAGPSAYTITEFIPTVYSWLNYNVYEPLEYLNSFTGFSPTDVDISSSVNGKLIDGGFMGKLPFDGKPSLLNATLLKRNGPYRHPSWKQTRGYENPLVKKWNSSNITAYNLRDDNAKFREDPPIISKYKPMNHILKVARNVVDSGAPMITFDNLRINSSYGNEKTLFANRQISLDIEKSNDNFLTSYDRVLNLYTNSALDVVANPVQEIKYFSYQEQIYPSTINMYSKRNRERIGYKNTFWRNSREDRTDLGKDKFGGENSQGYVVSQSAWALDAAEQFGTGLSTYIAESASIGSSGELQNDYTMAYRLIDGNVGDDEAILPSPIYARKHTMGSVYSAVSPTGPQALRNAVLSPTFLTSSELTASAWPTISTFNQLGHISIFGGNAKFEAHEMAGYIEDGQFISSPSTPFYDKYELYVHNMRLKNKDMSLIPEFRISDHIQKYLNDSNGFLASNTASFSIFGINQDNTETVFYKTTGSQPFLYDIQVSEDTPQNSGQDNFYRIYSFSDFMEYFDIVSEEHDKIEDLPKSLTLSCKALMKFIAYDGFYPAERTLEIANAFSESYAPFVVGSTYSKDIPGLGSSSAIAGDIDTLKMRPFMAPFFSPGIMYNTIKSGIAVDYPIYTSSYETIRYFNYSGSGAPAAVDYSDYYAVGRDAGEGGILHHRFSFESLLDPVSNIKDISIYDMEPHPSCSIPVTAKLQNPEESDLNLNNYKLIVNNFFGEIPNFFLKNESLTSLISKNQEDGFTVKNGEYYGMRIAIRGKKSTNSLGRESAGDVPQQFGKARIGVPSDALNEPELMTMYSRPSAFGPPMAGTSSFSGTFDASPGLIVDTLLNDSVNGYYTPYTPPYYIGEAWADVMFQASADGNVTLDEIFANASVKYWRVFNNFINGLSAGGQWPSGEDNSYPMHQKNINLNAMQISSSVNLFLKEFVPSNDLTKLTPRWVIQSKFETPILNFGDQKTSPLNFGNITTPTTGSDPWLGYCGKTTTPIGMWHQFGTIPEGNNGISLEVREISQQWREYAANPGALIGGTPLSPEDRAFYNDGNFKSLAEVVGFSESTAGAPTTKVSRMGKLSDSKKVYEAVVAVPFVENEAIKKLGKAENLNRDKKLFFELPVIASFAEDTEINKRNPKVLFPPGTSQDILDMAEKVWKRYVFPPQFDFIRNLKAKPVAMYIFDFEHTFDKNDLSYIWQNIAPKFGTQFKESVATISHPLMTGEMIKTMKNKVKWMVFKVKQRAETNYYNKIVGSSKAEDRLFGYNWPYDNFSMVEFAKMDAQISYGSPLTLDASTAPISQTGLPPTNDISLTNSSTTAEAKKRKSDVLTQGAVAKQLSEQEKK